MVYQRGNQREGSPHYILLYSEDEDSGGEDENIPLQSRNRSASTPRKIEVINIRIKADDTLQALALRYRCTISELKRINKIHKENEIFAKQFIKVPVKPFSVLTENINQSENAEQCEHKGSTSGQEVHDTIRRDQSSELVTAKSPKEEINAIILNSVCEPLSSYSNTSDVISTEHDQLLNLGESDSNSYVTETFKCSGDDCGLSWAHLLGFSLLLGFAGPIIYILYITKFSSKSHSAGH